jgi:hypothetical protein
VANHILAGRPATTSAHPVKVFQETQITKAAKNAPILHNAAGRIQVALPITTAGQNVNLKASGMAITNQNANLIKAIATTVAETAGQSVNLKTVGATPGQNTNSIAIARIVVVKGNLAQIARVHHALNSAKGHSANARPTISGKNNNSARKEIPVTNSAMSRLKHR